MDNMDEETFQSRAIDIPSSPPLAPRYRVTSPTSSIPPIFSSDGPLEDADVTNYVSPRYKRKRAGPWWAGGRVKKAKMARNIDSGVWMASDASDNNGAPVDLFSDDFPAIACGKETCRDVDVPAPEVQILRYIEERIDDETNNACYDFSGFGLQDDALVHLRKINQVIKPPLDAGVDVPTEFQYRSFCPALYVSLASNSLSRLAPSVFELEHLRSLILRDNEIKILPPQIAKLRNLKELDLSRNKLEYLPAEILDLLRDSTQLERLQLLGNPLLEPIKNREGRTRVAIAQLNRSTPQGDEWRAMYRELADEDRATILWVSKGVEVSNAGPSSSSHRPANHHRHCPAWYTEDVTDPLGPGEITVKLMARTLPSYYDQTGILVKGSPAVPSPHGPAFPVILDTSTHGAYGVPKSIFEPAKRTKVKSLYTLSLESALSDPNETPDCVRYKLSVDEDGEETFPIPHQAEQILSVVDENVATTFRTLRTCHCCGKDYIVPRAEWIEFWQNGSVDCLPIKVQVCSWGCVPDFIAKRPAREVDI